MEATNDYLLKCFRMNEAEGVFDCTREFLMLEKKEGIIETPIKTLGKKDKVFIVHGRDEKPALQLQKFLKDKLGIDAKLFEDFKEESGSNTIIEQLEYIKSNVGYAFAIVTPDDLGCLLDDMEKLKTANLVGKSSVKVKTVCDMLETFKTRARQNVVFEFGLFMGALGRGRVCCLLQEGTQEKPSDIDGILYTGFSKSVKEKFAEIEAKLKNAALIKT